MLTDLDMNRNFRQSNEVVNEFQDFSRIDDNEKQLASIENFERNVNYPSQYPALHKSQALPFDLTDMNSRNIKTRYDNDSEYNIQVLNT